MDIGRRLLDALGTSGRALSIGGASLEVSLPAQESGRMQQSALLTDVVMRPHVVAEGGEANFAAFLDGVQESRVVAYIGAVPVVYGRVGAVVRARLNRRLSTWGDALRLSDAIYLPLDALPPEVARRLSEAGLPVVDTSDEGIGGDDVHPQQMLRRAVHLVQREREALERELAACWCATPSGGALYVDGGLPSSAVVLAHGGAVGVVKSHHTLYTSGAGLATVMSLGVGERSSVLVVETKWRVPVASWYLRLRDPQGHDPLWGLARIEASLEAISEAGRPPDAAADRISAWVVAESTPLALPDARWDTMAYGIRDCEVFLRALIGSARL